MKILHCRISTLLASLFLFQLSFGQEPMQHMQMRDTLAPQHHEMQGMDHMTGMKMTETGAMCHSFSVNLPMNRNGSGTGWLPDASPMYGYMVHKHGWMYMLHGNLFLRFDDQDFTDKGSRGHHEIDAPGWAMLMGQRRIGRVGLFHFNMMFSFDPLTARSGGFPLLFQTGEEYKGKPILDRQHPHDLFAELSTSYSFMLSKKSDLFFYIGYPGEPALGPVAFMHRPSALSNPDVPISHHWADATRVTFGVATVGLRYDKWKFETSSFTGREPDENRYNFDRPRFDSWSGRLSFNPSENWAFQVSQGFIKSPEALHPGENISRTTASAIYSAPIDRGSLTAAAVWGVNNTTSQKAENAILLEGSRKKNRFEVYSRIEWVQKSTEELALDDATYGANSLFPIFAGTAGFNFDIFQISTITIAAGSQVTFYHADDRLNSIYGRNPLAFEIFLRLYPSFMR